VSVNNAINKTALREFLAMVSYTVVGRVKGASKVGNAMVMIEIGGMEERRLASERCVQL
jgi:hypothetical protein